MIANLQRKVQKMATNRAAKSGFAAEAQRKVRTTVAKSTKNAAIRVYDTCTGSCTRSRWLQVRSEHFCAYLCQFYKPRVLNVRDNFFAPGERCLRRMSVGQGAVEESGSAAESIVLGARRRAK